MKTQRNEARIYRREARHAERRLLRKGGARRAIEGLGPGVEIDVLTYGQFNLIDLWDALLERYGPGDVFGMAWTIGRDEVERVVTSAERGHYRSLRLLVDRAMATMGGGVGAARVRLQAMIAAGRVDVRTSQIHAKGLIYDADEMSVVVRTSMNLNDNPRTEFVSLSTDPGLIEWWRAEMEHIWNIARPGLVNTARIASQATPIHTGPGRPSGAPSELGGEHG